MAKYKCLPNYELRRNGKTIIFNIDGYYETDKPEQIELLDKCKPFIQRLNDEKLVTKPAAKSRQNPKK